MNKAFAKPPQSCCQAAAKPTPSCCQAAPKAPQRCHCYSWEFGIIEKWAFVTQAKNTDNLKTYSILKSQDYEKMMKNFDKKREKFYKLGKNWKMKSEY